MIVSTVKDALIAAFLVEQYCLPGVLMFTDKCESGVPSSSSCVPSDWEKESLKQVNSELCKELSELSIKTSDLESKGEKLMKSKLCLYSKHRNNKKKLQRKVKEVLLQKKEIMDGKKMIHDLEEDLKKMKLELSN